MNVNKFAIGDSVITNVDKSYGRDSPILKKGHIGVIEQFSNGGIPVPRVIFNTGRKCWIEQTKLNKVLIIKATKIARKMNKGKIIAEKDGYITVKVD